MSRVSRYLDKWEKAGLISTQQLGEILEFENDSGRSYAVYGLIMLGITVISIGIISVVAANWEDIPVYIKLCSDFTLISCSAVLIYYARIKNKPLMFDAFTALFMFLYLASIGLISQIYHTGGHLYQALFLWTFVTMPVILFAYGKFTQGIWVTSLLTAIIVYCLTGFIPEEKFLPQRIGVIVSLPVFCGIMGVLLSQIKITKKMSEIFIFYALFLLVVSISGFDLWHSCGIRYDSDVRDFLYVSSPFYIAIAGFTLLFIVCSFLIKERKISLASVLLSLFYLLMFFSCILFSAKSGHYSRYYNSFQLTSFMTLASVISISGLFLTAFLFLSMGYNKLFSLFLNLIGIRFLIIYFQVFGSLAYTGFGLIISGLLIIFSVIAWKKYSVNMIKRFIKI